MFKIVAGGLAAALLFVGAAQAEPSARQRELAKDYIETMQIGEQITTMMKAMMPSIMARNARGRTTTPEEDAAIIEVATEVMAEIAPRLVNDMQDVVAEVFSEEEMIQATAFYKTPVGRSILGKSGEISARMAPLMAPYQEVAQQLMVQRMLERFCPGGKCDAPRRKRGA